MVYLARRFSNLKRAGHGVPARRAQVTGRPTAMGAPRYHNRGAVGSGLIIGNIPVYMCVYWYICICG